MTAKFRIGDRARIAPAPYWRRTGGRWKPYLRPGRVILITAVRYENGHTYYRTSYNGKGWGPFWLRSDELRRVEEPDLRRRGRK